MDVLASRAGIAVLFATTFWDFPREFPPLDARDSDIWKGGHDDRQIAPRASLLVRRQPPRPPAAAVAAPQARPACLQTRGYATWLGSAY